MKNIFLTRIELPYFENIKRNTGNIGDVGDIGE